MKFYVVNRHVRFGALHAPALRHEGKKLSSFTVVPHLSYQGSAVGDLNLPKNQTAEKNV